MKPGKEIKRDGNARKARRQNRRRQQPNSVTAPLTERELNRQTRRDTRLRFRPLERTITGELQASQKRTKDVGDWWDQYLSEVNQGRAETQAAYDQAGATAGAQMTQASQLDSANTQRLNAEESESAALRGVAPSTAPSQREAAMAAQRNAMAASQAATTSQLGANQYAYLTDQKRIGRGQSIAGRVKEQERGLGIRRDMRAVRQERGDYAATKRGELRDNEFEKQVQRSAFNLDRKQAAQQAREAQEDRRLRESESAADRNQRQREIAQEDRRLDNEEKGGGKKEGRYTRSERNDLQAERQNALAAATSFYKAAGSPRYTAEDWNNLIALVATETGVGYAVAKQAVNKLRKG